jgi:hypothetical protein
MKQINNATRIITLFAIICGISVSCNNEKDKDGKTKDGGPAHDVISTFYTYRIDRATLQGYEANDFQKLIINIALDDLSDPSYMNVWYYEAQTEANGGRIGASYKMKNTTETAPAFVTQVLVTNNELLFADYKDQNGNWLDFTYLILTPTNLSGNLGFSVSAILVDQGGTETGVNLPAQASTTKPSPPAPPMFLKNNVNSSDTTKPK